MLRRRVDKKTWWVREGNVSEMLRKIGFDKFKKERELYAGSGKEDKV